MATERTIGIFSPGEMGSQVGRVLREEGARVLTCVAGRSDRSRRRAAEAGFEILPSMDEVVRRANLIISVVPSLSAKPLADAVAGAMRRTGSGPMYLDANSIGPQTARSIAQTIAAAGGQFVDGSIIGNATQLRAGAIFYLSGERAEEVAGCLQPPLETSILGSEPGQASGFKVLYAGLTKGISALGVELLAGAERLGLREQLLEKYRTSLPSVRRFFDHTLPGLPQRAGRRSEEMVELAETLEQLGLTAHMAHGAQLALEAVARRYRENGGPDGDDLDTMVLWWTKGRTEDSGLRTED